ncbi:hypothetical protein Esti_000440 [Eimeria stiedai]
MAAKETLSRGAPATEGSPRELGQSEGAPSASATHEGPQGPSISFDGVLCLLKQGEPRNKFEGVLRMLQLMQEASSSSFIFDARAAVEVVKAVRPSFLRDLLLAAAPYRVVGLVLLQQLLQHKAALLRLRCCLIPLLWLLLTQQPDVAAVLQPLQQQQQEKQQQQEPNIVGAARAASGGAAAAAAADAGPAATEAAAAAASAAAEEADRPVYAVARGEGERIAGLLRLFVFHCGFKRVAAAAAAAAAAETADDGSLLLADVAAAQQRQQLEAALAETEKHMQMWAAEAAEAAAAAGAADAVAAAAADSDEEEEELDVWGHDLHRKWLQSLGAPEEGTPEARENRGPPGFTSSEEETDSEDTDRDSDQPVGSSSSSSSSSRKGVLWIEGVGVGGGDCLAVACAALMRQQESEALLLLSLLLQHLHPATLSWLRPSLTRRLAASGGGCDLLAIEPLALWLAAVAAAAEPQQQQQQPMQQQQQQEKKKLLQQEKKQQQQQQRIATAAAALAAFKEADLKGVSICLRAAATNKLPLQQRGLVLRCCSLLLIVFEEACFLVPGGASAQPHCSSPLCCCKACAPTAAAAAGAAAAECLDIVRLCCRLSAVEIRLFFYNAGNAARQAAAAAASSSRVLAKRSWDPRAIVPRQLTTNERAAAAAAVAEAAAAAFSFSVSCMRLFGQHAELLEEGPVSAQALVRCCCCCCAGVAAADAAAEADARAAAFCCCCLEQKRSSELQALLLLLLLQHDIFKSFQEASAAALDFAEETNDKHANFRSAIELEALAAAARLLGGWVSLEPSELGSLFCLPLSPEDVAPLLPALLAFSPDDWFDREGVLDLLLSILLETPGALDGGPASELGCLCSSLLAAAFLSPLVERPFKFVRQLERHQKQLLLLQQQLDAAAAALAPFAASAKSSSSGSRSGPRLPPCPFPLLADVGPLAATPAAELCVKIGVSVHQALLLLLHSSSSGSAAAAAVAGAGSFSRQTFAQVAALQQQLQQQPKPFRSLFSSRSSSQEQVRKCLLWLADVTSCCAALVGLRCNAAELQQLVTDQQQDLLWHSLAFQIVLLRPDSPDEFLSGPRGAPGGPQGGEGPSEALALWLRALRVALLVAQRHPRVSAALATNVNLWKLKSRRKDFMCGSPGVSREYLWEEEDDLLMRAFGLLLRAVAP